MRILEPSIIISIGFTIVLFFIFLAILIYKLVDNKSNRILSTSLFVFYMASLCLLIGLFSLIIDISIIDLPVERIYKSIWKYAFMIAVILYAFILLNNIFNCKLQKKSIFKNNGKIDVKKAVLDLKAYIVITDIDYNVKETNEKIGIFDRLPDGFKKEPKDIINDDGKHYKVLKSAIERKNQTYGYSFIFYDVSKLVESEKIIEKKNEELKKYTKILKDEYEIKKSLEQKKQEDKLLLELQQKIITSIEEVLINIELLIKPEYNDLDKFENNIKTNSSILRKVYKEVREAVYNMKKN